MNFSEKVHTVSIASDLRFAIRITNRNRSQIARFGAFSKEFIKKESFDKNAKGGKKNKAPNWL